MPDYESFSPYAADENAKEGKDAASERAVLLWLFLFLLLGKEGDDHSLLPLLLLFLIMGDDANR